jgi:hypothetical protein
MFDDFFNSQDPFQAKAIELDTNYDIAVQLSRNLVRYASQLKRMGLESCAKDALDYAVGMVKISGVVYSLLSDHVEEQENES